MDVKTYNDLVHNFAEVVAQLTRSFWIGELRMRADARSYVTTQVARTTTDEVSAWFCNDPAESARSACNSDLEETQYLATTAP